MMMDLLLLAIIAISALLGLLRGFIASISGLLAWLLAIWAALRFGMDVAIGLFETAAPTWGQRGVAYLAVFVVVLIVASMLSVVLRGLVDSSALLKAPDRALGLGFGLVRGVVLAALVLVVLRLTPWIEPHRWQDSQAAAWLTTPKPSETAALPWNGFSADTWPPFNDATTAVHNDARLRAAEPVSSP